MLKTTLFLISMGAVGATLFTGRPLRAPIQDKNQRISTLNVSVGGAHRLDVKVPLGKVVIIADNSRELSVRVTRSAKRPFDPDAKRWLADSYLTADNKGGILTVRDYPFGKASLNERSSESSKFGDGGQSLDLVVQIHVPSDLAANLNVTAGEATFQGRFHSVDANIGAGTLISDSARCASKMDLHVGAGEAKLIIPSGASADVLADVSVGKITGLPDSSKHTEGIHLGDKRHGRTGGGDSKVTIHVGAGDIKVESRDRILASIVPDDFGMLGRDTGFVNVSQDQGNIDKNAEESVRKAMAGVDEALKNVGAGVDVTFAAWPGDQNGDLRDLDGNLAKMLSQLGPEIEKAMKEAQPEIDMAIKQSNVEIDKATMEALESAAAANKLDVDKAIKQAMAEFQKAMKNIQPEIDKAMKANQPEIDKAVKQAMEEVRREMKNIKPEIEKSMKTIKPEIEKAIREAMKELENAQREIKNHDHN